MSYYPEDAEHALEALEEALTQPGGPTRQGVLDKWLETIHTPRGAAEHDLCAYVGRLAAWPEQPVDFVHLRRLVTEANIAWASGAATGLARQAKAKRRQSERAEDARLAKEKSKEARHAAILDIYLHHYPNYAGGKRNAKAAAEAIRENWDTVTQDTVLEDIAPPNARTIADIIRKSPRYKNN